MLKGEKVVLRPFRREDVVRIWEFRTDVAVELASGGDPPKPIPLSQVEHEFEQRTFIFDPNGSFAMESEGALIGFCGLFAFDDVARHCELGITIGDPEYWGRGYGRDAVMLLLDYAFRMRNMQRVWLHTNSTNDRAMRCYRACGFVDEGRQRRQVWCNGAYADLVHMGILREEWEARAKQP